jgi:hypothetical protein
VVAAVWFAALELLSSQFPLEHMHSGIRFFTFLRKDEEQVKVTPSLSLTELQGCTLALIFKWHASCCAGHSAVLAASNFLHTKPSACNAAHTVLPNKHNSVTNRRTLGPSALNIPHAATDQKPSAASLHWTCTQQAQTAGDVPLL